MKGPGAQCIRHKDVEIDHISQNTLLLPFLDVVMIVIHLFGRITTSRKIHSLDHRCNEISLHNIRRSPHWNKPHLSWKTWSRLFQLIPSRKWQRSYSHIFSTLCKPTRSYARLYFTPGIWHEPQPGCSMKTIPWSLQKCVQVLDGLRML